MTNQNDNFSYVKANGKRALRSWVLATFAIFLVLAVIIGYSVFAAHERQAQIAATPRPAAILAPTLAPTLALVPTVTPTVDVGATSSALAADCPTDSTQWTFTPIGENSNYARIDPPCVYHGMDRVIAWIMASQGMGWDQQTAINSFSFVDNPYNDSQPKMDFLSVTGKPFSVSMTWYPMASNDLDWYVVNNSVAAEHFVVGGCYSTYTMVNGQKKYWSSQYASSVFTAICAVYLDRFAGWSVYQAGDKVYARDYTSSGGLRLTAMLGYDNNPKYHTWYLFGFTGPGVVSSDENTTNLEGQMQQWFNSPLWDLNWIEKQYGMFPKPLPDKWQKYTSQADLNDYLAKVNK